MDLNPVALLPSPNIPFIPNTDLSVHEKTYGEAEDTLSDSTVAEAFSISLNPGKGFDGVSGAIY